MKLTLQRLHMLHRSLALGDLLNTTTASRRILSALIFAPSTHGDMDSLSRNDNEIQRPSDDKVMRACVVDQCKEIQLQIKGDGKFRCVAVCLHTLGPMRVYTRLHYSLET